LPENHGIFYLQRLCFKNKIAAERKHSQSAVDSVRIRIIARRLPLGGFSGTFC
jgi:hypothetical protein